MSRVISIAKDEKSGVFLIRVDGIIPTQILTDELWMPERKRRNKRLSMSCAPCGGETHIHIYPDTTRTDFCPSAELDELLDECAHSFSEIINDRFPMP